MKRQKRFYRSLGFMLGLILIIVGMVGSHTIKTNYGKTKVNEVKIVSESGYELAMDIFVPENATSVNPAPTILVQHGGNNCKEEMKLYCIELSKRGYVAIGVDMYGMGESEILPDSLWLTSGRGLYDAVKYARTLPYVDIEQIGLLGYSRGGKAASEAMQLDNVENNYIRSAYLIYSDPIYRDTEGYVDIYQARDIGVLADYYDEFFFSEKADDTGVYSNDANKYAEVLSSPVDFIKSASAQSFLYFGEDPNGKELRKGETIYEKDYDGKIATRLINSNSFTHMSAWYSPSVMKSVITFFDTFMPGPISMLNDSFTYMYDDWLSLAGMFGLLIFMISFVLYLVQNIEGLNVVYINEPTLRESGGKKGILWLWGLQIAMVIASFICIYFLNKKGLSAYRDWLFRSANPTYHGLIAIVCGTFSLVCCILWYKLYGKKNNFDLKNTGIHINKRQMWKTILTAIIGVFTMYLIIFIVDYLFGIELRFVYWKLMPFSANRIPGMLVMLPMYLVFYIAISVCSNCFNFSKALGKNKWLNNIITSFLAALPTLLIIIYVYGYFKATGWNPMFGGLASSATAIISLPGFIFFAVLGSRYIYQKTGNPYLGGIINGIIAVIVEWTVCEIRIPEVGEKLPVNMVVYGIIIVSLIVVAFCVKYLNKVIKTQNKVIE